MMISIHSDKCRTGMNESEYLERDVFIYII